MPAGKPRVRTKAKIKSLSLTALPDHLLVKGQPLPLRVRESSRAKRLTLRLRPEAHGEVILTLPLFYSKKQVFDFIEKSKPWLEKQMAKSFSKLAYIDGMLLPVLGKSYELRHKPSLLCRSWWGNDHLLIHAPSEKLGFFVQKSLHQVAKQFLQERTLRYANQLGKPVNRITLRDTRSRWGSCSPNGNISYSWRLIFAPEQVADYVCAHEAAHLAEMNHSSQFWQIVEEFCPNYKKLRQWLRQNGKSLFQYGG
jgi:predicted metal-dependent hydrolase